MKVPTSVTILGQRWVIKRDDRAGDFGETDIPNRIIHLDRTLKEAIEATYMMHELLHAVSATHGNIFPVKKEEGIVTCLAPALVEVIRSNKLDFSD